MAGLVLVLGSPAAGQPLDSDVLKVAHHGSRSSSSEGFLERVSPLMTIISAGQDNRYGHPHAETLAALSGHVADNAMFTTADNGTIELITDGRRLQVKVER